MRGVSLVLRCVHSVPPLSHSLHKTLLHVATQQEGIHKPRLDQLLEVRVLEAFGTDPGQPAQSSLGEKQIVRFRSHWAPCTFVLPPAALRDAF